jgi:hypothetical protein
MHKNINLPDADGLTDAQFNHLFSPDAPPKALAEALKHRLDILKQGLEITDINLGLCQQIVTALGDCNIRDIPEAEIKSTFKNCLDLIAATRKATKTCLP